MSGPPVRLPRVIGHRGAAAHAPENTLAGFRVAKALGAEWVEFDVRLTADERLVLVHDADLARTTGRPGLVRETSGDAIRARNAGSWFGPTFSAERVPDLDQAVGVLQALGLGANIEMKCDPGLAAATARVLAETLDRCWPGQAPPLLVSSFDADALAALREAAPHRPRGYLVERVEGDWRGGAERLACSTLHVGARGLTRAGVETARSAGLPLAVYTVNDAERARLLFDWGVDSIVTDAPDAILAVA